MILKFLLFSIALILPATAHAYCSEPSKPYCVDGFNTFTDEFSFDSCVSDMQGYQRDVEDYVSCLQNAAEEATSEYADTVERFNCKAADPDGMCF